MFDTDNPFNEILSQSCNTRNIEGISARYSHLRFPSLRELFSCAYNLEDFSFAYRRLVHYLVRMPDNAFNIDLFREKPIFTEGVSLEDRVLAVCAIHYHLKRRDKELPPWVFEDVYRLSSSIMVNEISVLSDVLQYHGVVRPLKDLGVI